MTADNWNISFSFRRHGLCVTRRKKKKEICETAYSVQCVSVSVWNQCQRLATSYRNVSHYSTVLLPCINAKYWLDKRGSIIILFPFLLFVYDLTNLNLEVWILGWILVRRQLQTQIWSTVTSKSNTKKVRFEISQKSETALFPAVSTRYTRVPVQISSDVPDINCI